MTTLAEPRTEAGREFVGKAAGGGHDFIRGLTINVLAIEAEASRLALEGVAERVRGLPTFGRYRVDMEGDRAVMLDDVLALLSPASEDGT